MRSVLLSSVTRVLESGARPKGGVSSDTGEIPSLGGEHLNGQGGFSFAEIKRIPTSFFHNMRAGRVRLNDILIVKDGATTGKVSFVGTDFPFDEAAINEHLFRLEVDTNTVYPRYIFHFLLSEEGQRQILSDFRGSTVGGIGRTFLGRVRVPFISLKQQRRVAEILDQADELRRRRRAALALLKKLDTALFVQMFGNPLVETSRFPIQKLGDVCSIIRDGTHKTPTYVANGVPFVTVKNIVRGELDLSAVKYVSLDEHRELTRRVKPERGDVLVSKDGTIGVPCPVRTDDEFSIFVSVALIRPDTRKLNQMFLTAQLKTDWLQKQIRENSKGIAIRHLHLEDFRRLNVVVPSLSEQAKFCDRVERVRYLQSASEKHFAELEKLFHSLQQRAFRGELTAKDDERELEMAS